MEEKEVQKIMNEFRPEIPDLNVTLIAATNFKETHGYDFDKENPNAKDPSAAFIRTGQDTATVIAYSDSLHSPQDVREALRHEIFGHGAFKSLENSEQQIVADKLIASKDSPGLDQVWAEVEKNYPKLSEDQKAEEVYAFIAENKASELYRQAQIDFTEDDIIEARKIVLDTENINAANYGSFVLFAHSLERDINRGERQIQERENDLNQDFFAERQKNTPSKDQVQEELQQENDDKDRALANTAETEKPKREDKQLADDNQMEVDKKGKELEDRFIVPASIERKYDINDGKYYDKKSPRIMFQDKGTVLKTSSVDKTAIASMIELAKAKQWQSLKLEGSREFRQHAWLEAESQGIKTVGYTPTKEDIARLNSLTNERSKNTIKSLDPVIDKAAQKQVEDEKKAPRMSLDTDLTQSHSEASKNVTSNLKHLRGLESLKHISQDDLLKAAYWRGIVEYEHRDKSPGLKKEFMDKFDELTKDPSFIKELEIEETTIEEIKQARDTEQELSL